MKSARANCYNHKKKKKEKLFFSEKDGILMVYKDSERENRFSFYLSGNYLPLAYHFHPLFQKYLPNQPLLTLFVITAIESVVT